MDSLPFVLTECKATLRDGTIAYQVNGKMWVGAIFQSGSTYWGEDSDCFSGKCFNLSEKIGTYPEALWICFMRNVRKREIEGGNNRKKRGFLGVCASPPSQLELHWYNIDNINSCFTACLNTSFSLTWACQTCCPCLTLAGKIFLITYSR